MCGHGERAMTAASLLQRAGHRGLAVIAGKASVGIGTKDLTFDSFFRSWANAAVTLCLPNCRA